MAHDGIQVAEAILDGAALRDRVEGDGKYRHRVSGVSRCLRDMVMHARGVPWSNAPEAIHGRQIVFDQGHDIEDRVIKYMDNAGFQVTCQQLEVTARTPARAIPVTGHIDGVVIMPEGMPRAGQWLLMDVKSIGGFGYGMVYDEHKSTPKPEHMAQLSVYAHGIVTDPKYPDVNGFRLRDLKFGDATFGGCIIVYCCKERPKKWKKGSGQVELPFMTTTLFDVDESDADVSLDLYDEVDRHVQDSTLPEIPPSYDPMVWGRVSKEGVAKAIRCDPRWCARHDVCQGRVEMEFKENKE
jgi:hypothetical protein